MTTLVMTLIRTSVLDQQRSRRCEIGPKPLLRERHFPGL
jgi:hypothetical protein